MDAMGTIKLLEIPKIWFSTQEFEHVQREFVRTYRPGWNIQEGAPLVIR